MEFTARASITQLFAPNLLCNNLTLWFQYTDDRCPSAGNAYWFRLGIVLVKAAVLRVCSWSMSPVLRAEQHDTLTWRSCSSQGLPSSSVVTSLSTWLQNFGDLSSRKQRRHSNSHFGTVLYSCHSAVIKIIILFARNGIFILNDTNVNTGSTKLL